MEKIQPGRDVANAPLAGARVLLTGGTGAVGRYVVDALRAAGVERIVLVVRDLAIARATFRADADIDLLEGSLEDPRPLADRLPPVDAAILAAAAWDDGARAWRVNVDGHVAIAEALRIRRVHRVVWLGTASILSGDGRPLDDAERLGTPYIASKAVARRALRDILGDSLRILHPTLVVGGAPGRPATHLTRLVAEASRYAWIAQFVTADGAFHLVHAEDLARMACEALVPESDAVSESELIAGAPATLARELLDHLLERNGMRRFAAVRLTARRLDGLARLLRVTLSPWDRRCLEQGDFRYDAARLSVSGTSRVHYPTARAILAAIPR